jgi:hypothetical protein
MPVVPVLTVLIVHGFGTWDAVSVLQRATYNRTTFRLYCHYSNTSRADSEICTDLRWNRTQHLQKLEDPLCHTGGRESLRPINSTDQGLHILKLRGSAMYAGGDD